MYISGTNSIVDPFAISWSKVMLSMSINAPFVLATVEPDATGSRSTTLRLSIASLLLVRFLKPVTTNVPAPAVADAKLT